MTFNKLTLEEKLAAKSKQEGDCIVWTGAKFKSGYGMIRIDGKWRRAHRVMYQMVHGAVADDLVVMHSCDNPACINIQHLSAATQLANVQDMHQKGRAKPIHGEVHPKAKLSTSEIETIRSRYVSKSRIDGASQIARDYQVSKQAILAIVKHKSWK
ncbi:HNH endonuclease signature motif containing protein [Undibacterium sp. Di24W]|uniref:HNH endonuclease signature motif containing protein n=1 Tax=Undibacterium sp. Di24W TaxID=3413033 RepID=UPI003BF3FB7B